MTQFHVVTDSAANFTNPYVMTSSDLTIIPNTLVINGMTLREDTDIHAEDVLHFMLEGTRFVIKPPTMDNYLDTFRAIAREGKHVVALLPSRQLKANWHNANAAAAQMGYTGITLLDTRLIDAAQGILVNVALEAIIQQTDAEEVERIIRGAVDRIYTIFSAKDVETLMQSKILAPSHAKLSEMLGVVPCLTLEDGEFLPIEKIRTAAQAVERLLEFVVEFTDIEDAVILQGQRGLAEVPKMLQDRLMVDFADYHFPILTYKPSLASLIGADATGVVILEKPMEFMDGQRPPDKSGGL
jgi:DegV family protein with EDD domain